SRRRILRRDRLPERLQRLHHQADQQRRAGEAAAGLPGMKKSWISSVHGRKPFYRHTDIHNRKPKSMPNTTPVHLDDPRIDAARLRLQNTKDQADTFEAIREIIANLFGCEEMALYRVDKERAALWLVWSFGIDPNTHAMVDLLNEPAFDLIFKG